jgi:hypothetical protein
MQIVLGLCILGQLKNVQLMATYKFECWQIYNSIFRQYRTETKLTILKMPMHLISNIERSAFAFQI